MFDPAKKLHQAQNSQNFLKNPALAKFLVQKADIKASDQVLEIGPGRGILTDYLLQTDAKVLTVEKDPILANDLVLKFGDKPNLTVVEADFLKYKVPFQNYKVFANPPFGISSQLVKKIVFDANYPTDIYLFLQKEFASRLIAKQFNTQLSVLVKAWYELFVIHQFKPTDFSPVPGVDVVLVRFKRYHKPKIETSQKVEFVCFVGYAFAQQKSYLEKNLSRIFTHEQWKKLAREIGFEIKVQPGELHHMQWMSLFQAFMSPLVSPEKKKIILG